MIVKNDTDVRRWMEQDGKCGLEGEFCSPSCEEHCRHVAIGNGGRVFARGTAATPAAAETQHLVAA